VGGKGLYDLVLALPEAKWSTYNFGHKPITIQEFCFMVTNMGVERPKGNVVTVNGHTVKGWDLAAFIEPVWDWFQIDLTGVRGVNEVRPVEGVSEVMQKDGGVSTSRSISPSTPKFVRKGDEERVNKFTLYNPGKELTEELYRKLISL
jgi:hypothetical protein